MKPNDLTPDRFERLIPLLRSISREIRGRMRSVERLDARIASVTAGHPGRRNSEACLRAELAVHRRELRAIGRELARLGGRQAEENPLRIVFPGAAGSFAFEGCLEETGFRPRGTQAGG